MTLDLALRFAAAVGLGVLLGLERERTAGKHNFAGVRTFGLVALLGAVAAYMQLELRLEWLAVSAFGALTGLTLLSYNVAAQQGRVGITTEVMALLAFFLGGLCVWGYPALAAALAVTSVGLLTLKDFLHGLAKRIEPRDVSATLKFAIITLIILPLLPNQNYGPAGLEVINPYKIWLMVVLISGLNFASYLVVKVIGGEHGLGLTGLLGGLVSSTAVTLGFSQRSRTEPHQAAGLAMGILLAWTVMFFRVLAAVTVVNAPLGGRLWPGLGLLGSVSLLVCAFLWRRSIAGRPAANALAPEGEAAATARTPQVAHNPFELSEAIKFGVAFGVITFVAKAAEVYLGQAGLYLAGALAGLTDVDAISLSMANLAAAQPDMLDSAARTVLIAVLSNTAVKSGMVLWLAAPPLRRLVAPVVALLGAAGAAVVFLVR